MTRITRFFQLIGFACIACLLGLFTRPAFSTELPNGYTELEYVESTGTQWIDTRVAVNNANSFDIKTLPLGTEGYLISQGNNSLRISTNRATCYSVDFHFSYTLTTSEFIHVQCGLNYMRVNGGNVDGVADHDNATGTTVYLFASNSSSSSPVNPVKAQVKRFKIYDSTNALVRDLIPAKRNSDNKIGMYDTVTRRFFTNAGTGEFREGPVATHDIKIATTKYVDQEFQPVNTLLTQTNTTITNLISQSNTNTASIATLAAQKQNRPASDCPEGWKCLLVKDISGADNWYPIVDGVSRVQTTSSSDPFTPQFTITTTNLAANTEFQFKLSAKGTFTVDWGDGTRETIDRSAMLTPTTYSHTYTTSGQKTIGFRGTPTAYNNSAPAIGVSGRTGGTGQYVAAIGGSLGALFPTLSGSGDDREPNFWMTFHNCQNITSIPSGFFNGITGNAENMFYATFASTGITSIPTGLFSNVSGHAANMFASTFAYTNITQIPSGLFNTVSGSAPYMFYLTFAGTPITSIPTGLFSNVSGNAEGLFSGTFSNTNITSIPDSLFSTVSGNADGMFSSTFSNCANLASIPSTLFSHVTGSAPRMFSYTFSGTNITSIPAGLFSGVLGGAESMFLGTFENCTRLASIPAGLFSGINHAATQMFSQTFIACTSLTGYIPATLFSGLINNGSPYINNMMNLTFSNTGSLATTCPSGTTQVETGYETYWDNHVACQANAS